MRNSANFSLASSVVALLLLLRDQMNEHQFSVYRMREDKVVGGRAQSADAYNHHLHHHHHRVSDTTSVKMTKHYKPFIFPVEKMLIRSR